MAKITELKNNSGEYFDRAVKKADKGDLLGCLDLLWTAQNNLKGDEVDEDLDIRLEIAETYANMGLYVESNRFYLNMLSYDYCIDETLFGLIRNFLLLDNTSATLFYIEMGIKEEIFDEEFDMNSLLGDIVPEKKLKLLKKDDGEYVLQVAKQLMVNNDVEYSRQMLKTVLPESDYYTEALNCLSFIEMSEGNYDKCFEYCNAVLEKEPDNFAALTNKLVTLNLSGKSIEAGVITAEICGMDIKSLPELVRLCICFAETGNSVLTKKYSDMVIERNPYNKEIGIINALANYNIGNTDTAKAAATRLNIVYPDDLKVKICSDKIFSASKGDLFELRCDINESEYVYICDTVKEILSRFSSTIELLELFELDNRFFIYVSGILSEGRNSVLIDSINRLLNQSFDGGFLVKDLLSDPLLPVTSKKNLFYHALITENYLNTPVVVNNIARWFNPYFENYDFRSKYLKSAYYKVFASLAFLEDGFERKLKTSFKKIAAALIEKFGARYKFNDNAAAAFIAYKSKINVIFSKTEYCCEVFDCDRGIFEQYETAVTEILNTQKKGQKKERSGTENAKKTVDLFKKSVKKEEKSER